MGLEIYRVLSEARGKPLRPDEAWIILNEIPEGHWTAEGKLLTLSDVSRFMGIETSGGHAKRRPHGNRRA